MGGYHVPIALRLINPKKWRFPEIGVPHFIIHFSGGFSMISTIWGSTMTWETPKWLAAAGEDCSKLLFAQLLFQLANDRVLF